MGEMQRLLLRLILSHFLTEEEQQSLERVNEAVSLEP